MRRIRAVFEYLLVHLGRCTIPIIPRRGIVGLANSLGFAAYYVASRLRKVGLANLDIAFKDTLDEQQKKRILKASYQSFALTLLDVFWFSRWSKARLERWIHLDDSVDVVFNEKSLVCITGHLGNWEHYGQAVAVRGAQLASVVAPLKNKAVNEMFLKMRAITGQEVVPKQGAIKHLIRLLRAGKHIAVLLDQNTKPADGGIFVDYFGLPVPVSQAAAMLAIRTNSNIIMGFCLPEKNGTYTCRILFKISPDSFNHENPKATVQALTQHITHTMEKVVRAHPEHWLWTYKRWKFVAPGHEPSAYPFYSKQLTDLNREKALLFEKQVAEKPSR